MTGSLQEKSGKYYAVLSYTDDTGKRKLKWINTRLDVKGNKKQADKMLRKLIDEWETKNLKYEGLLVSEYFEQWINGQQSMVSPNSYRAYSSNMRNHIIPYFKSKGIKIQELKVYHLEDYYALKSATLSAQSIKHHHQNISKALNDAVRKEIIPFSPAANAKTPKVKKFVGAFLNPSQIKELIGLFEGTSIKLLVSFLCMYGLRRSEAIGLTWNHVDFENNQFTVSCAILQHTGGDYTRNTTKNDSSYRTLPLTSQMKEALITHKMEQNNFKKMFGNEYADSDYVFTWQDGKLISPNYLSRTFHKVISESSLPPIRVHDLRHSAASNLLAMGFSIVEVQQWLGHAEASTTLNFYSHVDSSSKRNISDMLEKILPLD